MATIEELRARAKKAEERAKKARKLLADKENAERTRRNKILDHFKFTVGGIWLATHRDDAEKNDTKEFAELFKTIYSYIESKNPLIREEDKQALRDGLDVIEAEIKAKRLEKKKKAEGTEKTEKKAEEEIFRNSPLSSGVPRCHIQ